VLDDRESAELRTFVAQAPVSDAQRTYLEQLLVVLTDNPPPLDQLLRSLVERMDSADLADVLLDDLVAMANVDGVIDPREEGLLRLVCGALQIDPVSLYEPHERAGSDASAAELAQLVRGLLQLDGAA
jgi:hypothetical protein